MKRGQNRTEIGHCHFTGQIIFKRYLTAHYLHQLQLVYLTRRTHKMMAYRTICFFLFLSQLNETKSQ